MEIFDHLVSSDYILLDTFSFYERGGGFVLFFKIIFLMILFYFACRRWFLGPQVTLHDCLSAFFSADELKGL